MAIIEVKVDPDVLERGVHALQRIADALEFLIHPKSDYHPKTEPAGIEALSEQSDEAEWEREQREKANQETESDPETL